MRGKLTPKSSGLYTMVQQTVTSFIPDKYQLPHSFYKSRCKDLVLCWTYTCDGYR
jgi:hypothetical protein